MSKPWPSESVRRLSEQFADWKTGVGNALAVGMRNLFDKQPPLTPESYLGSLCSPYARYWYTSVSTEF